jgi:uncharacterized SAM-binding protein YcdF (DUF218 family)
MLKIITVVGAVVAGTALAVWGISSYLTIDDLKDCAGPDAKDAKCAPADVIIAISGGDTQARTAEAIKLYKAGWAPHLIFSGAALDVTGPSNAEAMRAQALGSGVPENVITLDKMAADTSQNAKRTRELLNSRDTRVILVTSPYHQRRASMEFQKVLGDNVTIINHPTQTDSAWGPYWWTTPYGWLLALSEMVKTWIVSTWR